jgi:hypothetical protein
MNSFSLFAISALLLAFAESCKVPLFSKSAKAPKFRNFRNFSCLKSSPFFNDLSKRINAESFPMQSKVAGRYIHTSLFNAHRRSTQNSESLNKSVQTFESYRKFLYFIWKHRNYTSAKAALRLARRNENTKVDFEGLDGKVLSLKYKRIPNEEKACTVEVYVDNKQVAIYSGRDKILGGFIRNFFYGIGRVAIIIVGMYLGFYLLIFAFTLIFSLIVVILAFLAHLFGTSPNGPY